MKIFDLRTITENSRVKITASVQWEDCDQPARDLFIETEMDFFQDISCDPHAFLVGAFIPAAHFGEKRILLDAEIDPLLKEGINTAMAVLQSWSDGHFHPPVLETKTSSVSRVGRKPRAAGLFLSGGIDSLAALRLNRLNYPLQHPASIKDCLMIHGFDIGGVVERGMKYHVFDRAVDAMTHIAKDAGVRLIPVYTNMRHLCDDRDLWLGKFFGAVLASIGHAFVSRFELLFVASSYDIGHLVPCGSHPLLDPEYSSSDLRIKHRDLALSRLEKLKLVSQWDAAFQNFRVCLANTADRLNCGQCEKCLRTMIELIAVGALHKTEAFVEDDVDLNRLSGFNILIRHRDLFYRELLKPLAEQGRDDIVETVKTMLNDTA